MYNISLNNTYVNRAVLSLRTQHGVDLLNAIIPGMDNNCYIDDIGVQFAYPMQSELIFDENEFDLSNPEHLACDGEPFDYTVIRVRSSGVILNGRVNKDDPIILTIDFISLPTTHATQNIILNAKLQFGAEIHTLIEPEYKHVRHLGASWLQIHEHTLR